MGYRAWGTVYKSGELSDKSVFTKFKFKSNIILKAIRVNVIVYNDPTFTDLNLKIYSDVGGSPGQLLATSTNVQTKAQVHTLDNGAKEIYFQFAEKQFNGETFYHLVINGTGYSPTSTKYLAWEKQTVDPIYSGSSTDPIKYASNPHKYSVISSPMQ